MLHPNAGASITVRELLEGARTAAEKRWPGGSPGGSDKRFEARMFVALAIEEALKDRGLTTVPDSATL